MFDKSRQSTSIKEALLRRTLYIFQLCRFRANVGSELTVGEKERERASEAVSVSVCVCALYVYLLHSTCPGPKALCMLLVLCRNVKFSGMG